MFGICDLFVVPPALRFASRCRHTKKSQLLFNVNVSTVWGRSALLLYFVQVFSGASAFFAVARFTRRGRTKKLTVSSTTVSAVLI